MSLIKGAMRRIEEIYSGNEISFFVWSDKFDLVAVGDVEGEVTIRRMNWKFVWKFQPPRADVKIKLITWCPDGKLVAVAYDNNALHIVDIDRKLVLNIFELKTGISCMSWTEEQPSENRIKLYSLKTKSTIHGTSLYRFKSNDGNFMPNSVFEKIRPEQTRLNYLVVASDSGQIDIYLYGLVMCGRVDAKRLVPPNNYGNNSSSNDEIIYANVSKDLRRMFVLLRTTHDDDDNTIRVRCAIFNLDQFHEHAPDVYTLVEQCNSVLTFTAYIEHAMRSLEESWESIVANEMLLKLNKYAADKPPDTLSADFLEMYMFGSCIKSAEQFIQTELNENQLKRISASIDTNHRAMSKCLMKHLKPATDYLTVNLATFRGLLKSVLITSDPSLTSSLLEKCIVASAGLNSKLSQMLSVLEDSKLKYKAFFRWLNTVYSTISGGGDDGRSSASFLCTDDITQREIKYVTDYIAKLGRLTSSNVRSSSADCEELGQYLLNENLAEPRTSQNSWSEFLADNPQLFESSDYCSNLIPPEFNSYSLVQQLNHLKKAMSDLYDCFSDYVTSHCSLSTLHTVFVQSSPWITIKVIASMTEQRSSGADLMVAVLTTNEDEHTEEEEQKNRITTTTTYLDIYDVADNGELSPGDATAGIPNNRMVRLNFDLDGDANENDLNNTSTTEDNNVIIDQHHNVAATVVYRLLDAEFYIDNVLSLLLHREGDVESSYYTQLPIDELRRTLDSSNHRRGSAKTNILHGVEEVHNMFALLGKDLRLIKNMQAVKLTVSGYRKVLMVMAEDKHNVRTFELEAEKDDDTVEGDTGNSLSLNVNSTCCSPVNTETPNRIVTPADELSHSSNDEPDDITVSIDNITASISGISVIESVVETDETAEGTTNIVTDETAEGSNIVTDETTEDSNIVTDETAEVSYIMTDDTAEGSNIVTDETAEGSDIVIDETSS